MDEWERLRNPEWQPAEEKAEEAPDITRNKREFTALIRTEIFRFLRGLVIGDYRSALTSLGPQPAPSLWTAEMLAGTMEPYYDEHDRLLLDNEARNGRYTFVEPAEDPQNKTWKVSQVLVDLDAHNDWQAVFTVDLAKAREEGKPTLILVSLGPVAEI